MAGFTSVGMGATGTAVIMDAGYIIDRVANILRRADLKTELMHWVNMAQGQLAHRVRFPELRTAAPAITVLLDTYSYSLPLDFAQIDRVYYKANYATPIWGRGLTPLPQRFYQEPVDLERQLNTAVSSRRTGDPQHYIIQNKTLIIDSSPVAATLPAEIYVTYYRIPIDLISVLDLPEIDKQWRQYLIWIALYWGKAALEQEDIAKASMWESKANKVIDTLARKLNVVENPREDYVLPDSGMEGADTIF